MKIFNLIGVILLFGALGAGAYLQNEQNEKQNAYNVLLIKTNEIANRRVSECYRDFHTKYAPMKREDFNCPEIQEHLRKKHSSFGNLCKHLKVD